MCTALTLHTKDHYFGRNLDLDYSYQEQVVITPRGFPFRFRNIQSLPQHHAIIGIAYVQENYPLYYDAVNQQGLAMAGLNFPDNARYFPPQEGKLNLSPFELIPYLLGTCGTVAEVRPILERLNICDIPFNSTLPLSPLHWIISDKAESIVVESTEEGLQIYDDPAGVLTNNPPFPYHLTNLTNYMALNPRQPENRLACLVDLSPYSRGMGALGLPGDLSSPSRFVRAAFFKAFSLCGKTEAESVSQFFHILDGVAHPRGAVEVASGRYQITVYSCCCNQDRGIYYYKTYENSTISAVDMHREDLSSSELIVYPIRNTMEIHWQN